MFTGEELHEVAHDLIVDARLKASMALVFISLMRKDEDLDTEKDLGLELHKAEEDLTNIFKQTLKPYNTRSGLNLYADFCGILEKHSNVFTHINAYGKSLE